MRLASYCPTSFSLPGHFCHKWRHHWRDQYSWALVSRHPRPHRKLAPLYACHGASCSIPNAQGRLYGPCLDDHGEAKWGTLQLRLDIRESKKLTSTTYLHKMTRGSENSFRSLRQIALLGIWCKEGLNYRILESIDQTDNATWITTTGSINS